MAKKIFPCGHKGLGQYCHQCQTAQVEAAHKEQAQLEKQVWKQDFKTDTVDLRILPNKLLVEKARSILIAIQNGEPYTTFKGKRMIYNRNIVSVPIGIDYRMLFEIKKVKLTPLSLMSHEDYNTKKPGSSKLG